VCGKGRGLNPKALFANSGRRLFLLFGPAGEYFTNHLSLALLGYGSFGLLQVLIGLRTIRRCGLILFQFLDFGSLMIDLALLRRDLTLKSPLRVLLVLQFVTDHTAGYCAQARADQCALPRVMDSCSDDGAGARSQRRAADYAFLGRGQALCPAAANDHTEQKECCRSAYQDYFHKLRRAAPQVLPIEDSRSLLLARDVPKPIL